MMRRYLIVITVVILFSAYASGSDDITWSFEADQVEANNFAPIFESEKFNEGEIRLGYPMEESVHAYYLYDETTEDQIIDYSDNPVNKEHVSGSWPNQDREGVFGDRAYEFDIDTEERFSSEGHSARDPSDGITLAIWIKSPHTAREDEPGCSRHQSSGNEDREDNYHSIWLRCGDSQDSFAGNIVGAGDISSLDSRDGSPTAFPDNEWFLWVISYNPDTEEGELWQNEQRSDTKDWSDAEFPETVETIHHQRRDFERNWPGLYSAEIMYDEYKEPSELLTPLDDQGTLLSSSLSFSDDRDIDSLELTGLDYDLNGETVEVVVETDEGEQSDPITLDGGSSYDVAGLSEEADTFNLDISLETDDVASSPVVREVGLSGDAANEPPEIEGVVSPEDGEEAVGLDPDLEVDVYDPDGDDMTVTFYEGSPGSDELGSSQATNTENAILEAEDHNLGEEPGTEYEWSIEVDDGEETTESDAWSFTTVHEPEIVEDSAEPDGETVSTTPELSVEVEHEDDREMDVAFFVDGEGFVDEVVGFDGGEASVSVDDRLDADENYEWHVEVDDGEFEVSNEDSPWSFDTDSGEPVIETEFGDDVNVNPSEALLDVRPDHSHAGELDNVTLLDSNDNVVDYWEGAEAGEVLTLIWEDLDRNQEYEWTAEVEHAGETERTSVNSFTTFAVDINLVGEVEDAEAYNIYRREGVEGDAEFDYGDGDYEFLGSASELGNLRDATEGLEEGGDYCYVTTAENLAGESTESNEECVEDVSFDE